MTDFIRRPFAAITSLRSMFRAGAPVAGAAQRPARISQFWQFGGIVLAAATMVTTPVHGAEPAHSYPTKPIRFILPLAAGGGTDIVARAVAKEMQEILGQPIYIENRPGANGTIASQVASRAAPDGYTVVVGTTGTHLVNQFLYSNLPYDPVKDFEPISTLARYNNVVVVPANSPYRSIKDLVQAAKQRPGEIFYGTSGIGNSAHLATALFMKNAKINMTGVPYGGSAPAILDLLGGRIHFMFDSILSHYANINAGKERALATTALNRAPALPDVPTVAELGYPGFEAVGWVGLFAPAGTPKPILDKLAAALKKVYESPELHRTVGSRGVELVSMTPDQYRKYLVEERTKWSEVIRQANIKLD